MTESQAKQLSADEKEIAALKEKIAKLEAELATLSAAPIAYLSVELPEPASTVLTKDKLQRLKDKLTEEERNYVGLSNYPLVYTVEDILSYTGEQVQALVDANRITFDTVPATSTYWTWRSEQPKVEVKLEPKVEVKK